MSSEIEKKSEYGPKYSLVCLNSSFRWPIITIFTERLHFFLMLPQREIEGYCLEIDNYDKRAVLAKMILRIGEPLNEIPGFKR